MALYQKWRPTDWNEVVGNTEVVQTLQSLLDSDQPPHAFLLIGPTGCGKTTLGRIIASHVGSFGQDFREINTADMRGIDTAREVIKQSRYPGMESTVVTWLIDECHKLTNEAQNSLLKLLEDPPAHVFIVMATTEPQSLLKTIPGRCSTFTVKPLNDKDMFMLLRRVVKGEGQTLPKAVYDQIIQDAVGLPRNAISILEQVLVAKPEHRIEVASRVAAQQNQSIELCRALMQMAPWTQVSHILTGLVDEDPEGIRRHIRAYCQTALLKGENDIAASILDETAGPFFQSGFAGLVTACYAITKGV